jgi:hypothetical protein
MQLSRSSLFIAVVVGHGAMILPIPRNNKTTDVPVIRADFPKEHLVVHQTDHGCEGYSCLWFSQGCTPGCKKCAGPNDKQPQHPQCDDLPKSWTPWITWDQQKYNTYANSGTPDGGIIDMYIHSPWRSPGEAPVMNSCGMAAGGIGDNKKAAGFTPPGVKSGALGTALPPTKLTKWVVGQTVEVAFGLWANHGGGYQYRLCPADSSNLDEECFKKMPLEYADGKQAFFWNDGPNKGKEIKIDATRLAARDGSIWTKNPIPAYGCAAGGVNTGPGGLSRESQGCTGPQFTPAIDGHEYWGFSDYILGTGEKDKDTFLPFVKDFVKVPNAKPGNYVLSWRWDCEQSPQVWNSCADIEISAQAIHV